MAIRRLRVVLWKVLRQLPESVLRRLLGWGDSGAATEIPTFPAVPLRPTRLLIAPHNAAAQGWYWARAAETRPDTAALSMYVDREDPFLTPSDVTVPESVYLWSRPWQRRAQRFVGTTFTHVIIESGWRLFGNGLSGRTIDEVRWLQRRGIAVALLFHGSDIRDPDRHAAAHVQSPFAAGAWEGIDGLRQVVLENRALIAEAGLPVFISTPDLFNDLPDATWLPVAIDPLLWQSPPPFGHDGPLRVVHAPSSSVLKGTDLVEPMLNRLNDEHVIHYVRASNIPFKQIPEIFRTADVVLDQFRLGIYGVAACEAMAAGRLLISDVTPAVRQRVEADVGLQLPIVQASAAEVEGLLRSIAANPLPWVETAALGVGFVTTVHDGRVAAERMAAFLSARAR